MMFVCVVALASGRLLLCSFAMLVWVGFLIHFSSYFAVLLGIVSHWFACVCCGPLQRSYRSGFYAFLFSMCASCVRQLCVVSFLEGLRRALLVLPAPRVCGCPNWSVYYKSTCVFVVCGFSDVAGLSCNGSVSSNCVFPIHRFSI